MTTTGGIDVPLPVRRKAEAVGDAGLRWLRDLTQTVAELADEWQIAVGPPMQGGSGGYVAAVTMSDGTEAVLKLAIPEGLVGQGDFGREIATLEQGSPDCYVGLLRTDDVRRAVLLERLGRPLSDLGWSVEVQIDVIADALRRGWQPVNVDAIGRTGEQQANFLVEFVERHWRDLGEPCSRSTMDAATRAAARRGAACDPSTAVLIHGDAHPANVLEHHGVSVGAPRFKLIDPDGMISEPAHDLAIPLRGWSTELLMGDPAALGRAWCARMGAAADVDPEAIWEWALVERVSTGLFLLSLGDQRGEDFLRVADAWAVTT